MNYDGTFEPKPVSEELISKTAHFLNMMGKPIVIIRMPDQAAQVFYAASYQEPNPGISQAFQISNGTLLNSWIERKAGGWKLSPGTKYPENSQQIESEILALQSCTRSFYSPNLSYTIFLP